MSEAAAPAKQEIPYNHAQNILVFLIEELGLKQYEARRVFADRRTAEELELVKHAQDQCNCDELEVDDDALVSDSAEGDGMWVQAWVWIPKEDA